MEIPLQYSEYNYIDTQRDLLVDALVQMHGDNCAYCDKPFVNEQDHKYSRTIDHYHSQDWCRNNDRSFMETHGMENLVLAHKSCNSVKSNRAWLDDGTLEPRGRVRAVKGPRPELCETCMSGRNLLVGEVCEVCGSGPQPQAAPGAYRKSTRECSHSGEEHCGYCFIGIIPRVTPLLLT